MIMTSKSILGASILALQLLIAVGEAVAQTNSLDASSSTKKAASRFNVGSGLLVPGPLGIPSVGGGAWIAIGTGRSRLEVDYFYRRRQDEGVEFFRAGGFVEHLAYTDIATQDSVDVVFSRHFRSERRFTPHVFAGVGYVLEKGSMCHTSRESGNGRTVDGFSICDRSKDGHFVAVAGAGFDVEFGSRFFVRVRSRGTFVPGEEEPYPWVRVVRATMSTIVAGGGVRF